MLLNPPKVHASPRSSAEVLYNSRSTFLCNSSVSALFSYVLAVIQLLLRCRAYLGRSYVRTPIGRPSSLSRPTMEDSVSVCGTDE
jgi:hypothetical protein